MMKNDRALCLPPDEDPLFREKTVIPAEAFFRQFRSYIADRFPDDCSVTTEITRDTAVTLSPYYLVRLAALILAQHRGKGFVKFHAVADATRFSLTASSDVPFDLDTDPLFSCCAAAGVAPTVAPDGKVLCFSAKADILSILDLYARAVDFRSVFADVFSDFAN